jgi:hypothetical protein
MPRFYKKCEFFLIFLTKSEFVFFGKDLERLFIRLFIHKVFLLIIIRDDDISSISDFRFSYFFRIELSSWRVSIVFSLSAGHPGLNLLCNTIY